MSRVDIVGIAKKSAFGPKQTTMEYFPPATTIDPAQQRNHPPIQGTPGSRFPAGPPSCGRRGWARAPIDLPAADGLAFSPSVGELTRRSRRATQCGAIAARRSSNGSPAGGL